EVYENRWRYFVPIPGFIRIILVIAFDLSGRDIDCNCRGSVKIVPWALVAHPRTAVARADEDKVRLWIVVRRYPNGAATILPLVPALGPRFAAGFSRRGNRISLPQFFACFRIEGRDETPNAELTAGCADQNLSIRDERSHARIVAVLVFFDLRG